MLSRVNEWVSDWVKTSCGKAQIMQSILNAIYYLLLNCIYYYLCSLDIHVGLKGHNYYVHSLILGMWAQTSSVFVKGIYNTRQIFPTKCHFNIHDVKNYTICTTTRELSVIISYNQKDWLSSLDKSLQNGGVQKAYLGYNNNSGQQMYF